LAQATSPGLTSSVRLNRSRSGRFQSAHHCGERAGAGGDGGARGVTRLTQVNAAASTAVSRWGMSVTSAKGMAAPAAARLRAVVAAALICATRLAASLSVPLRTYVTTPRGPVQAAGEDVAETEEDGGAVRVWDNNAVLLADRDNEAVLDRVRLDIRVEDVVDVDMGVRVRVLAGECVGGDGRGVGERGMITAGSPASEPSSELPRGANKAAGATLRPASADGAASEMTCAAHSRAIAAPTARRQCRGAASAAASCCDG
jgi:hypothetical protein